MFLMCCSSCLPWSSLSHFVCMFVPCEGGKDASAKTGFSKKIEYLFVVVVAVELFPAVSSCLLLYSLGV